MRGKSNRINLQTLLEIAAYGSFMGILLYLIITGDYKKYVTPRTIPYFYFTILVLSIWTVHSLARLIRGTYQQRIYHPLVLFVPVILFFLPHQLIGQSNFAIGPDKGVTTVEAAQRVEAEESSQENTSEDGFVIPGLDEESKLIYVTDEDFGFWYTRLSTEGMKYQDYTIKIRGSVLKNSDFMKEDEFMISRLLMTCCVADVAPGGIICQYEQADEIQQGEWLGVTGTLQMEDQGSYVIARILVDTAEPIAPIDGYAYP